MKTNIILKASGIAMAMALSALAAPSMAQDMSSQTYDSSGTPSYLGPVDDRPWGNMPRSHYRDQMRSQPRGAQGPMRSDSSQAEGSMWDKTKSYFRQPVGNRGYVGFLDWRENNTDTP